MLSRVAESLYWIGRYVERAEDTSRLLDVHVHTLLEDPWVDEAGASRDVLAVMGVEVPSGLLDARRTTEWLAFRPGDTSSIVGALAGVAPHRSVGGQRRCRVLDGFGRAGVGRAGEAAAGGVADHIVGRGDALVGDRIVPPAGGER